MSALQAFELESFENFSTEGRCVNRLYRSPQTDVLLVCWEPGQQSSYHDHMDSESIVYIVEGRLTVVSGEDCVRYEAGRLVITPQGAKHQLINDEPERLVTLHVYSPRLETPISAPLHDFARLEEVNP